MKNPCAILIAASLVTSVMPGCKSKEKEQPKPAPVATPAPAPAPAPEKPLTVQDTVEVTVRARVKAISYGGRTVTLEDSRGNQIKFGVDERVQRLNQVLVGDDVSARYRATLLAELRPPTAEESMNPISIVEVEGRSPQGSTPAGTVGQVVRVVTTVEAVDVPSMLVTLRGPMGDVAVVRGKKRENVERLRVGDTIVITYTETIAIALEKIAPR